MKRSTSSKTTIAILLAIVVLLIQGTRRQRRLLRLFSGFTLTYPGEDQVNAVLGFFSGVAGAVKDAIAAAIRAALNVVGDVFGSIFSLINGLFKLIVDGVNAAKDFANGLMWSVLAYVNDVIHAARDFATWIVAVALNQARDFASWIVQQAINLAQSALDAVHWILQAAINVAVAGLQTLIAAVNDAWHAGVDGLHWLLQGALDAAIGIVDALIAAVNDAWHAALDVLHWTLQTAINTATAAMQQLLTALHDVLFAALDLFRSQILDRIGQLERAVFDEISTLVGVVGDVIDWLIGLALFPFTTARDMWAAMRSTGGKQVLAHAPGFVDRWGDHVLGVAHANVHSDAKPYQLPALASPPSFNPHVGTTGYSFDQLVSLANLAGVTGRAGQIAAAIALAESGGDPNAHNTVPPDDSYGLWQINALVPDPAQRLRDIGISSFSQLLDPATNAHAMYVISGGGAHWYDWTTYNNGDYRKFLPAA